jgi:hypothetical protein
MGTRLANSRCFSPPLQPTRCATEPGVLLKRSLTDALTKREELLQAIAHGSAAAWGHLNLLGEYDFSEDKLQDSVGIKPPKLTD